MLWRLGSAMSAAALRAPAPRALTSVALFAPRGVVRHLHTTLAVHTETAPAPPPPPVLEPTPARVYAQWYVYKNSGAVSVRVIPPQFAERTTGRVLERDGTMLLEFATANPTPAGALAPTSGGVNRTYNWQNKKVFALSANELGTILAGDEIGSSNGLTFFHDPSKLGKVGEPIKRLSIKLMADNKNLGFTIYQGASQADRISVTMSKGEFEVFKSVAHYAIPRLLGFDQLFA